LEHFSIEEIEISEGFRADSNANAFSIFTCVEGGAVLKTATHTVFLPEEKSAFIPATLGSFSIHPEKNTAKILKTVPIKN
jgi:mannose-6-phosphate isomerase class I